MICPLRVIPFLLMCAVAGCSSPRAGAPASADKAFAGPTNLRANLADPINIDLRWRDNATDEAGYFVEYSPDANGQYVPIEVLPPNSTRYRHAHLLPHTRFVFRVRPYFGKPSNVAEVTTGKEGPQQSPPDSETPPPASSEPSASLRSPSTIANAAPSDLTATLIAPAGVKLTWKDHASDEDGYLLEIKPSWEKDFKASAYLQPNTTSLESYGFPFEAKFAIRVRAFFYGEPSNVAEQTTGADPAFGPGVWTPSGASEVRTNSP